MHSGIVMCLQFFIFPSTRTHNHTSTHTITPPRTQAQATQARQHVAITQGPSAPPPAAAGSPYAGLYPSLEDEYMGLQLTQYRAVGHGS